MTDRNDSDDLVWAVSAGSYSDYSVLCVCPTKADAEAVAVKVRGDADSWHSDVFVEAFDTAAADVEMVEVLHLTVTVWDDGTTTDDRITLRREWPFDPLDHAAPLRWRWVRAPIHDGKGGRLEVSGTDHEAVRRTFSDRRAQLLADDAFRASRERKGSRTRVRRATGEDTD